MTKKALEQIAEELKKIRELMEKAEKRDSEYVAFVKEIHGGENGRRKN